MLGKTVISSARVSPPPPASSFRNNTISPLGGFRVIRAPLSACQTCPSPQATFPTLLGIALSITYAHLTIVSPISRSPPA